MNLCGKLESSQLSLRGGDKVEGVAGESTVEPAVSMEKQQSLHHTRQYLHSTTHTQVMMLQ